MDFSFSEDELALKDAVAKFAANELAPKARELDETAEFPWEHLPKLAEMGIMGMNLPEEYGGSGVSALGLALAIEEISAACAATASMFTANFLATDTILLGGGEEIKRRYLPGAASGEKLGAFAMTEPPAGSNPMDMTTRAVREGDGYRITGVKHFISNGGVADFLVVFAKTDPEAGHRGISAFVVDKDTPGFEAGSPENTMGIRAAHVYELSFDCLVPAENMIGAEGSGFKSAMMTLDRGRVDVAAMGLGIARAAFDAALAWAKERKISGQLLGEYQGIQWHLADMATQLEAARLLTYKAAALRESGERFSYESTIAKLFVSEATGKIADLALQIHGGYGFIRELPLERYVRDARILRIFEGASEVQRNILGRMLMR